METKFVWYGNTEFDLDKVRWNVKPKFDKPSGGLWGSFEQSPDHYTWKDWCEKEDFNLDHFSHKHVFEIKPDAKILIVTPDTIMDFLTKYDALYKGQDPRHIWLAGQYDFDTIFKKYDGWMVDGHIEDFNKIHGPMNGWDCDSICIWNRNIVIT